MGCWRGCPLGCSISYRVTILDEFIKAEIIHMLGTWKDRQFVSVMEAFRDDFADHGIRMVLCKRKSGDFGNKSKRWIEFIDVDITKNTYVPQFDVANLSGQVIKTWERTLEFPNGKY